METISNKIIQNPTNMFAMVHFDLIFVRCLTCLASLRSGYFLSKLTRLIRFFASWVTRLQLVWPSISIHNMGDCAYTAHILMVILRCGYVMTADCRYGNERKVLRGRWKYTSSQLLQLAR